MTKLESPKPPRTAAVDDYLKAIWHLRAEVAGAVGTSELARALGVSAPSASEMLRRLSRQRLVRYTRYHGVDLTPAGRTIAVRIVRAHRLVELFLARILGLPWERVHDEAERWEHVMSDDVLARMETALGHPAADVHGHPIPAADGSLPRREDVPLGALGVGQAGVVSQVSDHAPELLQYLGDLGLRPGARVSLVGVEPFGGSLSILVGGRRHRLGAQAAPFVRVQPDPVRAGGAR